MLSEEVGNISPTTVTPKSRQRDSGHLAVSPPARCPDSEPGSADARSETRLWANRAGRGACVPALKPRRSREGPWKKCQGFKPDPGNPAVRDYRGASGNVAMVELCTHFATERAGMVTLHLKAGAPEFYPDCPTARHGRDKIRRDRRPPPARRETSVAHPAAPTASREKVVILKGVFLR